MRQRPINAPQAPQPHGGYAQAVEVTGASRWLYISGQIPVSAEGEVPASFAEQARLVWRNLLAQLEAADMRIENLVKVTTFLASREHALQYRSIRQEFLGPLTPALTVIITGIFDEAWLLEVEAVAAA
jgi:2-iminobutanoate/2-iminopropanoate deaminase